MGDAGPDLVLVPGWVSHVEYAWEEPSYARFLTRLASFSRLVMLDRRGTGLSGLADPPSLEQRELRTRPLFTRHQDRCVQGMRDLAARC